MAGGRYWRQEGNVLRWRREKEQNLYERKGGKRRFKSNKRKEKEERRKEKVEAREKNRNIERV